MSIKIYGLQRSVGDLNSIVCRLLETRSASLQADRTAPCDAH